MMTAAEPYRTYLVYHHGLFAQGVRSVPETQSGVQIVGMEKSIAKALKAVASLKPEVIVVEQPTSGKKKTERLESFLQSATAGRAVYRSLDHDHDHATVYHRDRITAMGPMDLLKGIRGGRRLKPCVAGPDRLRKAAAKIVQPASDRGGAVNRSGQRSRVRRHGGPEGSEPMCFRARRARGG
jgi:chemotaxis response regulator CheB